MACDLRSGPSVPALRFQYRDELRYYLFKSVNYNMNSKIRTLRNCETAVPNLRSPVAYTNMHSPQCSQQIR